MVQRTAGIGPVGAAAGARLQPGGPDGARFRAIARDTRAIHPYVAYDRVPCDVRSRKAATCLARTLIRAEEFFESVDIVERCLDRCPSGPMLVEGFNYTPYVLPLAMSKRRAAKISTGACLAIIRSSTAGAAGPPATTTGRPLRYMLRGNTISDAPLIVASLDPCYSCTERVTVVDVRKKQVTRCPYKKWNAIASSGRTRR